MVLKSAGKEKQQNKYSPFLFSFGNNCSANCNTPARLLRSVMQSAPGVGGIKYLPAVEAFPSRGFTFCRHGRLPLLYFGTSPNIRKGREGGRLSPVVSGDSTAEGASTTAWRASSKETSTFLSLGMMTGAKRISSGAEIATMFFFRRSTMIVTVLYQSIYCT